jgi:hypothetical protein
MFVVFNNIDTLKIHDMRQSVVFNNGEVEERCILTLPIENYERETIDILKKYLNTGDGTNYTLGLKDSQESEVFKEFTFQGLVNIEWVAPENSIDGEPAFMACTRELIF